MHNEMMEKKWVFIGQEKLLLLKIRYTLFSDDAYKKVFVNSIVNKVPHMI